MIGARVGSGAREEAHTRGWAFSTLLSLVLLLCVSSSIDRWFRGSFRTQGARSAYCVVRAHESVRRRRRGAGAGAKAFARRVARAAEAPSARDRRARLPALSLSLSLSLSFTYTTHHNADASHSSTTRALCAIAQTTRYNALLARQRQQTERGSRDRTRLPRHGPPKPTPRERDSDPLPDLFEPRQTIDAKPLTL
jgi:hypothetical protein